MKVLDIPKQYNWTLEKTQDSGRPYYLFKIINIKSDKERELIKARTFETIIKKIEKLLTYY